MSEHALLLERAKVEDDQRRIMNTRMEMINALPLKSFEKLREKAAELACVDVRDDKLARCDLVTTAVFDDALSRLLATATVLPEAHAEILRLNKFIAVEAERHEESMNHSNGSYLKRRWAIARSTVNHLLVSASALESPDVLAEFSLARVLKSTSIAPPL